MEVFESYVKDVSVVAYINKDLARATAKVNSLGAKIQDNLFTVARIISQVNENECYKDDGFSSVHEWTKSAFGFASTRSHELLKIGREYTELILNEKTGKPIGTRTNLPVAYGDFTISQVAAMLPVGHEKAVDLVINEELKPEMTVREIKSLVKKIKGDEEPEEDSREEEAPNEEAVEDMETATILIRVTDESGNRYEVPKDILDMYKVSDTAVYKP